MIVSSTELSEADFMMLITYAMHQNVTILSLVIARFQRRRGKFIVFLDAKHVSSFVKRKWLILPCHWKYYVRKQLLHEICVMFYISVYCDYMCRNNPLGAKNNDSPSEKWVIVKFYTMEYRKCGNFN